MQKILILTSEKDVKKIRFAQLLEKYLPQSLDVQLAIFSDISIELEGGKVRVFIEETNITDFDLVYFRGTKNYANLANTLALLFKFLGVDYIDSGWGKVSFLGNKLESLSTLAVSGLPIIPTFFCNIGNKKMIDKLIAKFGFPIIAKELTQQKLEAVYVVSSLKDIYNLPKTNMEKKKVNYLFQKFIDIDKEYRLLTLGDGVGAIHTKTKRNYKSTRVGYLHMDEQIKFIDTSEVSEKIKKMAVRSASILGLDVAGVDICIERGTKESWLIEVNKGPGFEYDIEGDPEIREVAVFLSKRINQ